MALPRPRFPHHPARRGVFIAAAPCACFANNPLAAGGRIGYTGSRLAEVPPDGSREYRSTLLVETYDKKYEVQKMKKLIMLITGGILSAALPFAADTATVNGIEWSYTVNDGMAVIEKEWDYSWLSSGICNADGDCYEIAISSDMGGFYPEKVVIPAKLNGFPVVGIGVAAFYGAGYGAFCSGCGGQPMEEVKIPSSVKSIGDCAFARCSNLSSIVVPASVTAIGACAFKDCRSLKKVTLPKWCRDFRCYVPEYGREVNILEYAFENCPSGMKVTYKGESAMAVSEAWQKAQTVNGAVFRDGKAVGVVQVKVGKASKNGEVAVSGTITGLDGKKLAAKGGKVGVNGETATATLAVKDGTTATVTVGKDGISGSWNGAEIKAAEVGGNWTRTDAKVQVAATSASLPAGTLETLLPTGEPVLEKGGKWAFNKAATVKLSKDKTSAEWDDSKGKSNRSGLKLTYTPKTGTFKGSFKVYALEGADGAKKLKKYTANVTGVVVDGKGSG